MHVVVGQDLAHRFDARLDRSLVVRGRVLAEEVLQHVGGTMAFPFTALTESLRTTTPGKSRLILRSSSLWPGTASTGALVAKGASWPTSLTSLTGSSFL